MRTLLLIGAISVGLSAASLDRIAEPDWQLAIPASLGSPAGANSAQPQMTVSPRGVLLSWIERHESTATLKFAERTPAGWSPATIVATGNDWFVNWADVPSVLRLDDGTLSAHWLQMSGPETYAYDVRLAYSKDDGKTWSPSFTPHHDGTKREHGFASLFQMPGSGLGLIWLDGRAMGSAEGHGAHDAGEGAMSVRFGTFDTTWKQTSEMPVDLRVCECCPTTAAMTSDGPIVAYRNRSEEEIRDIYVARLENGKWTEPKAVHDDGWKIAACPVNGPMLSASGRNVVLSWFTVKDDVGHAYAAFSSDSGRTFGTPIRLDEVGALGRVDAALLPDGSALATWIEFANQKSSFSMRRIDTSGRTSPAAVVSAISGARASGYPRIAVSNGEAVFAWTQNESGQSSIKTAVLPLKESRRSAW
jgi:hypothetical protein